MEVAIAAGGTAGHINPALALAEELRDRGHHVTFFGQSAKLEGTLVPAAGFDFVPIRVSGIDRSRPWTAVTALARLRSARRTVGTHFGTHGAPDVAVGFGAYVEMPLLEWCAAHDVPVMLHEQNSVPGLANKTLARKAQVVAVALPQAVRSLEPHAGPGTNIVVTGNPVRRSVIEGDARRGRETYGVPDDATLLVTFGGSLGAKAINEAMAGLKQDLLGRPNLHVVHATGKASYEEVVGALRLSADEARRWHVVPYIENMGDVLAAADLVVSRAGASSIAEIAALAVPSILVPYPYATADHQTVNAQFLVGAHAAESVADDELSRPEFRRLLLGLLDDEGARAAMRHAAEGLAQQQAAGHLADQVERLGPSC
ncbi:UDP-N-acetylglucosamine--N-acetylmuramyl-(pentapeptide) pyrophosphoryl-undecaprenol N-acetylglucosamine transferase [Olsenella sp. YH-ols2217]|uniref:UDP-N-acetylglucosamine--N-acetylmuramyl-(pentapeptide) pyrophosphoryl-undecaprenol N-acetylglucosamine transferase n=1 Tax=Kribbibacterium absianum TaxID=3044210 RepID=A0ABT6ZM19_9ACTN|nr:MULTISPECIES: UDP-N-acetylglucosamine--N-acetylmuramyl-(pentapeptide) pyrophosphoryl-undecaprenol N-acetylglucosamine transferase [unclassified Olsenella]MDJ1122093.1 UDP-N-acetylglucosamine--N-acetylmuramyl-(pentapeptide) pyrophosphoryl-undecaprenol N-acetylglucosamine transferase [Olsenella sp. YH-ols2216]MDJ1130101.1 UDP-N-acetylglucosamine--N-acetylmuramyl-(pentapeptide) pyrophosphoryl-undecaprenol N-acetylglucosamine transferase [Olsenella sp. YH-ols2217]